MPTINTRRQQTAVDYSGRFPGYRTGDCGAGDMKATPSTTPTLPEVGAGSGPQLAASLFGVWPAINDKQDGVKHDHRHLADRQVTRSV